MEKYFISRKCGALTYFGMSAHIYSVSQEGSLISNLGTLKLLAQSDIPNYSPP